MNLKYNTLKREIAYEHANGKVEIIEKNYPSEPKFSPNKKSAVYIAPLEWETIGRVYIYDLENNKKNVLIEPPNKNLVPKEAVWIDNENLALILGESFGTVSIGGDIFTYNISSNNLKRMTNFKQIVQITSLEIKENTIIAKGIEYIDDNYLEYQDYHCNVELK